ncbi:MAG TPA: hypothetical protein VNG53_09520 [Bacteroidia bacterium]|nr:hypothetical protein [Bacteroidia bacterium]
MYYFIPENLNLEQLLIEHPPMLKHGFHIDCFTFLLGQITEAAARYRDSIDEEGFICLNAKILKKRVYNANEYMDYLIEHGIIICDNLYIPNEKSYGYRYADLYFTAPIIAKEIKKPTLVKSINLEGNYERNMRVKYDYLHKWFDQDLKIDLEPAIEKLEFIKLEEILRNKRNLHLRFNANLISASRINNQSYFFRIDETAGRLHTNLTTLKKQIRPYLSYQNEPLACIDIVCAQPTGILSLINPQFYEKSENGRITFNDIRPSIRNKIDFDSIWKHIKEGYPDYDTFKEDVMNDFYEAFRVKIEKQIGKYDLTRDDLKVAVYKVLYSDNSYFNQQRAWLKRLFHEIYPGVYDTIAAFKTKKNSALPILLQNLEAQVILDRVAKSISKIYPKTPLFTVHDSIMIPVSEVEKCKEIFNYEYNRALGITPNLKVELYLEEVSS